VTDRADVYAALRAMVCEITGRAPETVHPDAPLFRGGLELDSLSASTLLVGIEERFGVSVAEYDATLDSLRSLATLARLVSALMDLEGAPASRGEELS
jgi:acyl carrier protein